MIVTRCASEIREFTIEDIPQVADLHRRVFGGGDQTSPELLDSYHTYFTEVFLNNPWRDPKAADSLVYQEKDGRITGFLAVMPRRMSIDGQVVQAKITSQFVVDSNFRGLRGLQLLSAALAGPQDITITDEANANSRIIWEHLGGAVSYVYSMHWIYPLRPCQFALFIAKKKRFLQPFILSASAPFARTLDALIGRFVKFPVWPNSSKVIGQDLDCETLLGCLSEVGRNQSIQADYDSRSLHWLLQRADEKQQYGSLQKVLLKTEKDEIAGWYLYYSNPGGLGEVIQLHAKAGFTHDILRHLFDHASRRGVVALRGRMEPRLMQAFSDTHCLFHCGHQWVLLHSRRPELLQAFDRGTAGFSRLDGEWCLRFQ
jgi:hypothetical protein